MLILENSYKYQICDQTDQGCDEEVAQTTKPTGKTSFKKSGWEGLAKAIISDNPQSVASIHKTATDSGLKACAAEAFKYHTGNLPSSTSGQEKTALSKVTDQGMNVKKINKE